MAFRFQPFSGANCEHQSPKSFGRGPRLACCHLEGQVEVPAESQMQIFDKGPGAARASLMGRMEDVIVSEGNL